MIRFSSTQQLASEPATKPIASVVAEPPKEIPAPALELTAEPIARTPTKSSKPRALRRKAAGASKDVPQLAFEE